MAAEAMTYASLVKDLTSYADRGDSDYLAQIPRLIMMAENRIASEIRGLGLIKYVSSSFVMGEATLVKPERWRQTISFQYVKAGKRVTLLPRTLEYCRTFWPQGLTALRAPKYYADYDYEHFYISPTPDSAYPFELAYHEKPEPLSDDNQTNWTTQYSPQVLLFAALMEAAIWRKKWDDKQNYETEYNRAASTMAKEDQIRGSDRSVETKGK